MKKILVYQKLNKNLITRNSLQSLLNLIEKTKENKIVLDFNKVEFMSRSCADEYLRFKQNTKKQISEINISEDIKKILELVMENMNSTKYQEIEPVEVIHL